MKNEKHLKLIKVLIIDPNKNDVNAFKETLSHSINKYSVDDVSSYEKIFELLKKESYDIIIMEYSLPRLNTFKILKEILDKYEDTPVIILTGRGDENIAKEAVEIGAIDYIVKGTNWQEIMPQKIIANIHKQKISIKKKKYLEETLDRYKILVEKSNDAIYILDVKTQKFLFINQEFTKLFGYTREELKDIDFWDLISEDSKKKLEEFVKLHDEGKSEKIPDEYQFAAISKTGEEIFGEVRRKNVTFQGKQCVIGIFRSTRELIKEKKEIHRLIHRFITPLQSIKATGDDMLFELKESISGDYERIGKSFNGRDLNIVSYDIFFIIYLRLCKEIKVATKQKINNEVNKILKDLNQQSEELSVIINNDEIQIPLKEIQSNSYKSEIRKKVELLDKKLPASMKDFKKKVEEIKWILWLLDKINMLKEINIILFQAKLTYFESEILRHYLLMEKREEYDFHKGDLRGCIEEICDMYQDMANSKNIVINKPEGEFPNIEMSVNHMKRVFFNIIQNAVKYSYTRKGKIGYIDIMGEKKYNDIWIEISNFGIGILPDEIDKSIIFEQAVRGKLSGDYSRTGSGIGLTDAKSLIENHNGRIIIQSIPPRETRKKYAKYFEGYVDFADNIINELKNVPFKNIARIILPIKQPKEYNSNNINKDK